MIYYNEDPTVTKKLHKEHLAMLERTYQSSLIDLRHVWDLANMMTQCEFEDDETYDAMMDSYGHPTDYVVDQIVSHYDLEGSNIEREWLLEAVDGGLT